jgi:hypothetical protein
LHISDNAFNIHCTVTAAYIHQQYKGNKFLCFYGNNAYTHTYATMCYMYNAYLVFYGYILTAISCKAPWKSNPQVFGS